MSFLCGALDQLALISNTKSLEKPIQIKNILVLSNSVLKCFSGTCNYPSWEWNEN